MQGRDNKGRFASGNRISPGRRRRVVESAYLDTLVSQIPLAQWGQVADKALKDALDGDHQARLWLTSYLMGKPAQVLELQAQEVTLLAELLARFKEIGLSPIEVFKAMLQEISASPLGTDES
jgi:hypothetical protein